MADLNTQINKSKQVDVKEYSTDGKVDIFLPKKT